MEVLEPIIHETLWGGSSLGVHVHSASQRIGHLYAFIDNDSFNSRIEAGTSPGVSLHEWFESNKTRYGLSAYGNLPILGAMVEARQTLSIQVHPDDRAARSIADLPFGKNESFYTLRAPTSGKMFNGCTADCIEALQSAVSNGRVMDFVDTMDCEAEDYVYIEGGTLHAAAAGSLHFEVEENCERTYRIYDFERLDAQGNLRPLQIEKALQCIDVSKKSSSRKYGLDPIEERMYSTQLIRGASIYRNNNTMFVFAVMIEGRSVVADCEVLPGRAILLEPGEQLDVSQSTYMVVKPKALLH